jgi:large subunit ribosomal protein L31
MKTAIHPETFSTTVTCSSCGTVFATRSTRPSIETEICSECHPAYTGVEQTERRGSRIERFERRRAAAESR